MMFKENYIVSPVWKNDCVFKIEKSIFIFPQEVRKFHVWKKKNNWIWFKEIFYRKEKSKKTIPCVELSELFKKKEGKIKITCERIKHFSGKKNIPVWNQLMKINYSIFFPPQ